MTSELIAWHAAFVSCTLPMIITMDPTAHVILGTLASFLKAPELLARHLAFVSWTLPMISMMDPAAPVIFLKDD